MYYLYSTNQNNKSMTTYNFYYNGTPVTRVQFEAAVPENWENDCDELGDYSWGYYRALLIDVE